MSNRNRVIIWSLISIVAAASAALAIENRRPKPAVANHSSVDIVANPIDIPINQVPAAKGRNLSLQPEAFKLSKKLGLRFTDSQRSISMATGTLTIGSNSQVVNLTRRQNKRGERIEIAVGTLLLV